MLMYGCTIVSGAVFAVGDVPVFGYLTFFDIIIIKTGLFGVPCTRTTLYCGSQCAALAVIRASRVAYLCFHSPLLLPSFPCTTRCIGSARRTRLFGARRRRPSRTSDAVFMKRRAAAAAAPASRPRPANKAGAF